MNFSTFFSNQARKPEGIFGRTIMKIIFDRGNAFLNNFVIDLMSVQSNDCIIEIGSGTGKLVYKMAQKIDEGFIEGVDYSSAMVAVARKRNKGNIETGRVKISEGDFDNMPYENEQYSKACSVNTLYFWPSIVRTTKKIADILKPSGILVLAFEDIGQLKRRKLDQNVFNFYSKEEVQDLLTNTGFSNDINTFSSKKGKLIFHCVVAKKIGA